MKRFLFIGYLMALTANQIFGQLIFERFAIEDKVAPNLKSYNFNFRFQNTAKKTIKITRVESTCSCTISSLEKEIYLPHEKGEINGVFNIGNRIGVQEIEIIVHTNDISQSQIKLLLKIKILNPIEIKPRLVCWEKNAKLTPKTIRLTVNDPKWEIESILFDNAKLIVRDNLIDNNHIIEAVPLSATESWHDLIKLKLKSDKGETKTFVIHALIK